MLSLPQHIEQKIIDILTEVKKVDYMMAAIQEKTFDSNLITFYTIKAENNLR